MQTRPAGRRRGLRRRDRRRRRRGRRDLVSGQRRDGFGDNWFARQRACTAPADHVTDNTDRDDTNPDANPGATEVCDPLDIDEADGGPTTTTAASTAPPGPTSTPTQTETGWGSGPPVVRRATRRPAPPPPAGTATTTQPPAPTTAEPTPTPASPTAGTPVWTATATTTTTNSSAATCRDATGASCVGDPLGDGTDCNDNNAAVETEVCDDSDVDEDCSGDADDDDASVDSTTFSTFYRDRDTDGYGDPDDSQTRCDPTAGYTDDDQDCDDNDGDVNPGETEVCNDGLDNDCSGGGLPTARTTPARTAMARCRTPMRSTTTPTTTPCLVAPFASCRTSTATGKTTHRRATGDDEGNNNVGAVYVAVGFDAELGALGTSTTLTQTTEASASRRQGAELVGIAIADGDSTATASPTSSLEDRSRKSGGTPYGGVFVFDGSSNWWTNPGKIKDRDDESAYSDTANSELGSALSADGDLDGDGVVDLLVGAPAGAGYAVLLTSTTYIASGATDGDELREDAVFEGAATEEAGSSLFLGDLDGDGTADALVGAPEATVGTAAAGRVYAGRVPSRERSRCRARAASRPHRDPGQHGRRPGPVRDGSGCRRRRHPGPRRRGSGSEQRGGAGLRGAGKLHLLRTTALSADITFTGSSGDHFGFSVAPAGDHNGDGEADLLIGARARSSSTGAAYLAYGPFAAGTYAANSTDEVVRFDGEATGDEAGYAVHGGGDVDGDGFDDVLVGAIKTGNDRGTAYLIRGLGL